MLAAAIIITGSAACLLLGWAAYWLAVDARERQREADRADAWVRAHKAQIQNHKYLRDDAGSPE